MNILICISLWFIFGVQHSILARPFFKKILQNIFGEIFEQHFYRFCYFLSQCVIFYLIYDVISNIENKFIIFEINDDYKFIYYWLSILSKIFLIISVLQFDISHFIGIKQIINFFVKKKGSEKIVMNKTYLYKFLRHPMYLGIILCYIFSTTIITEIFITNLICILAYIEIGSYYEEKVLIKEFGNEYIEYKKNTYKYLPLIR